MRTSKMMTFLVLTVSGVLLTGVTAQGQTTWYVNDDNCPEPGAGTPADPFCKIQDGIDASSHGDTVLVADGNYTGDGNRSLDFGGRLITLRSENGPATCIIACQGTPGNPHRGFWFHSGESADAVVEGFTITNGYANLGGGMKNQHSDPTVTNCTFSGNSAGYFGGGMSNLESDPTVTDCTFSQNTAARLGGGMHNYESSPTVTNCAFSGNSAGGNGGGMRNDWYSTPTVTDCTFSGNVAVAGGGLHNDGDSSSTVINCTFTGNSAVENGGGMLNDPWSSLTVTNCTFSGNSAGDNGGGMCNANESDATLTNCTFSGNSAGYEGGGFNSWESAAALTNCTFIGNQAGLDGGAIRDGRALTSMFNCTFASNTATYGAGISAYASTWTVANCALWGNTASGGAQINMYGDSYASVSHCGVEGGASGVYVEAGSSMDWLAGNIDADPLFVRSPDPGPDGNWGTEDDDYGDLRLSPGSPCIDAGDNSAVPEDTLDLNTNGDTGEPLPFDLDGNPRFMDDPETAECPHAPLTCGTPPIVDMGPYEYFGDCQSNGVPDFQDIAAGNSADCNGNYAPDECEPDEDCNANGVQDICDIGAGTSIDCNLNWVPDECDIAAGSSEDCTLNGIPDECEPDCNGNGIADSCDILAGTSQDCNTDGIPDACQLEGNDCNENGIRDDCDIMYCPYDHQGGIAFENEMMCWDCQPDGIPDGCQIGVGQAVVTVAIRTDSYPSETTWELVEQGGSVVGSGGPYSSSYTLYTSDVILESPFGCYDFTIYDAYGDGMYAPGGYEISLDGDLVATTMGSGWCCTVDTVGDICPPPPLGIDCNENQIPDECDLAGGTSADCNENNVPDECDIAAGGAYEYETGSLSPFRSGSPAEIVLPAPPHAAGDVTVMAWASADLDDSSEYVDMFLNGNLVGQLFHGFGRQCPTDRDDDLVLISQALFNAALPGGITITLAPTSAVGDCSGVVEVRIVYPAGSSDCNGNGIPDECEPDCNGNGIADECDIAAGTSADCNTNGMPDECEPDCNTNGIPDECDIAAGTSADCNTNGIPDECDIREGNSADANTNGIPDECEPGFDIRPGSCPNPLNRRSHGVLPVALLGRAYFDAAMIDVSSVRLSRADGVGGNVAPNEGPPGPHSVFEDVGTPFDGGEWCDCHKFEGDGIVDLSMHFRTDDVVEALELNALGNGDLVELVITGSLLDGTEFTRTGDCILIVPKGNSNLNVGSSVSGVFIEVTPADLNVDDSGFADFQRRYNPGTVVTLTTPATHEGLVLASWEINGVRVPSVSGTTSVTLVQNETTAEAIYVPVSRVPEPTPAPIPVPRSAPRPVIR